MTLKLPAIIPLAFLCSCAANPPLKTAPVFVPFVGEAALSQAAPGIWMSDGYGYILDTSDAPKVYNRVGNFCQLIKGDQEGPLQFFDRLRLGKGGKQLFLSSATEPYEIKFDHIGKLPASCEAPTATDPLTVFDVFAQTYAEHYGFFATHGVDWAAETAKARAKLTPDSSEQDLVEAFIGLLSQLKDGHVSISATVNGEEGQFIAYPGRTNEAIQRTHTGEGSPMAAFGRQYLRRDIEDAILGGQGIDFPNERIKYGITGGDIGYMAVMSEGGFASGKDGKDAPPEEELAALEPALEQAMAFFNQNSVKAVVVDLSVNSGGYDYIGRAIAARFAQKRTFVYSKFAYDAKDQEPTQIYIEPSAGTRYVGPVYLLTSDMTVSAGESLAMSLRAFPNIIHAGEATRGAFSDVLYKYLPNGWEITLSNEVYTDSTGQQWEGRGLEPQVPIQVFNPNNPITGHMDAVEALISIIQTG